MHWPFLCTLSLAAALPPMQVTSVLRPGLPPHDGTERLYRVSGEGFMGLRPGQRLDLCRPGSDARPGRLQVVSLTPGGVLARLDRAGDHFPLIGDQVLARAHADMPGCPPAPEVEQARNFAPVPPGSRPAPPLAAFFFLKGDDTLSPAGIQKLRTWSEAWPRNVAWTLLVPRRDDQADLALRRTANLRTALTALGVSEVRMETMPPILDQEYDPVYVTTAR